VAFVGAVAVVEVVEAVEVGAHLLGRRDLLDDPVDEVGPDRLLVGYRTWV